MWCLHMLCHWCACTPPTRQWHCVSLVRGPIVLSDGLVAEEVFTVQAAAELLKKAQHVAHAVHHRQAQQVLLPIEGGCRREDSGERQLHTSSLIPP